LITESIATFAVRVNEQEGHHGSVETIISPVKHTPRRIEKSEHARRPCQPLELICSDHLGRPDGMSNLANQRDYPLHPRFGIHFSGGEQITDWIEVDAQGWATGDSRDVRDRTPPSEWVEHCAAHWTESLNRGSCK
jgi:hypothetical protein